MLRSRGGIKGTLLAQKSIPSLQYHFIHRYKCGVGRNCEEPRHLGNLPWRERQRKEFDPLRNNTDSSEAGPRALGRQRQEDGKLDGQIA